MTRRKPTVSNLEVRHVLERIFALPQSAQLEVFAALRDYLAAEEVVESEVDRGVRLRTESLAVMAEVAAHYALPAGVAPTVTQWRASPAELTQGWSATRVAQMWGRYKFATDAFTGNPRTGGALRQSVQRRSVRRRRTYEDELAGIQRWLDTEPASELAADYDGFVKEQNAAIAEERLDAKPLRTAYQLTQLLNITFPRIVAVVKGETALADARAEQRSQLTEDIGNDLGLIGPRTVASILGFAGTFGEMRNLPGFPVSVMRIGRNRAWLISDIEAYRDGDPVPQREEDEMQDRIDIVTTPEMAKLRGYPDTATVIATLHRAPSMLPPPDGRIGGTIFWHRSTVDDWLPNAPKRRASYKRRPDPSR